MTDSCSRFATFFFLIENIFIFLYVCLNSRQYLENACHLIEQNQCCCFLGLGEGESQY